MVAYAISRVEMSIDPLDRGLRQQYITLFVGGDEEAVRYFCPTIRCSAVNVDAVLFVIHVMYRGVVIIFWSTESLQYFRFNSEYWVVLFGHWAPKVRNNSYLIFVGALSL